MNIVTKLGMGLALGCAAYATSKPAQCFIYRDDIGAFWGIKGYEEQVSEVGTHHGHMHWPQFSFFGTYDSGSVRRGKIYLIRITSV